MRINAMEKKSYAAHKYSGIFSLIIIFLLPLYVVRFKIGWAAFNLVEFLMALFFLFWGWRRIKEKRPAASLFKIPLLSEGKYVTSIALIIFGLIFSIMAGGAYYQGLGILKGWFLFPIIFAVILYEEAYADKRKIGKYFLAIFYSGAALSLLGLVYWLSGNLTYDGRLRTFFDSPNQLAMTLAPALIIGICSLRKKRSGGITMGKPVFYIVSILFIATNLYLTKSAGALFAVAATILFIFFGNNWTKKKGIQFAEIFLIVVIIFTGLIFFQDVTVDKAVDSRSSLASRMMIWKSALFITKDNPILGIGPGNFQNKYLEYQKYFPPYLEWAVPEPHNIFLAFWLGTGILGLFGFLLLIFQFFRDNKKALTNNRQLGTLCLAIMLYFLLHGLVDTTYWKNDSAVVFWLVIATNILLLKDPERKTIIVFHFRNSVCRLLQCQLV